jgi:hypothetical protein
MAGVDHNFHYIAWFYRVISGAIEEMRKRRYAVRLVSDIYIDIGAGDFEHSAFKNLVPRRRRQMAVILKEVLILLGIDSVDRYIQFSGHAVV